MALIPPAITETLMADPWHFICYQDHKEEAAMPTPGVSDVFISGGGGAAAPDALMNLAIPISPALGGRLSVLWTWHSTPPWILYFWIHLNKPKKF